MGEKKKYPIGSENYVLYEEIGQGVSASVHRALCKPLDEIVAIKILDFERDNADLSNISREVQTMILVDHPNVLKSHCSFVSDHNLWVVMPFMSGGSCLHILKAAYPDGFEEAVIATILKEVLKGLEYLHQHGHIHRDVKAGNILIGARGVIKLGDFGVSACLFDSGDRQRMRNTFVGTPCWMAPEVMEQLHGYDFKADIWSFGITGLELAHGHAPFSKYPPMKVLLMTLQNAPPGLDYERDKKFSKSFKQMIASCLVKDPSKRPSAKKLLKHSFFKQARSNDYICRTLLEGLPPLGDRIKELKRKEEDMLAQKKMPDGEKEEISQNEYKRGISGWNFNLDDLKVQASLMPDEDAISHHACSGSSSSLSALDTQEKQSEFTGSNAKMEDNGMQTRQSSLPSISSSANIAKFEKSEDDSNAASPCCERHVPQNSSPKQVELGENIAAVKPALEMNGKTTEPINAQQKEGGPSASSNLSQNIAPKQGDSEDLQNQPQNVNGSNGSSLPSDRDTSRASKSTDGDTSRASKPSDGDTSKESKSTDGETSKASKPNDGETSKASKPTDGDTSKASKPSEGDTSKASKPSEGDTSKASKSSAANSDEVDEKAKPPVVQQRGRFKVTSENVEVDKTVASPVLQKSHSMQVGNLEVLTQINGTPAPVSTPVSTPISSNSHGASIFPLLNSVLQSNIAQRDNVLQAMRQLVGSDNAGNTVPPDGTSLVVQLEAAHEREKELLHEITELQWRLICAQEELQKYKTENARIEP